MLRVFHRAALQGRFELFKKVLHAAWDCQRQNSKRFFQRIVERMRDLFWQMRESARTGFQLVIASLIWIIPYLAHAGAIH